MLPSSYSFSNFLWNSVCVYCRCFYFTRPPHWVFSCIPHLFVPLYWNFFISAFHFTKFFPHYFQTPFKNTHRILGNGRVGNSKGLFFHRNKENLTKMIFIRTQRLTATKWSLNQKKKKKINWNTEREMCGILTYPCFIHPTQIIGGLWVPVSRSYRTDCI